MFQTWLVLTFTDASCFDGSKNSTISKPFKVHVNCDMDIFTSVVNLLVNSCSVFFIILF